MLKKDYFRKYRLRRLVLEAGEFTVQELCTLGDLEKGTVEAFLSDLKKEIPGGMEAEKIQAHRVGRPMLRYRLTPEGSRQLAKSNLEIGRQLLASPKVRAAAAGATASAPAVLPEEQVIDWTESLGPAVKQALEEGGRVTLRPEQPLTIRMRNELSPVFEGIAVSVEGLLDIIRRILTPWQLERFETRRWTEASYAPAGRLPFRLRADWLMGKPSIELAGFANRIPTPEDLLLPDVAPSLATSASGLLLVAGIENSGRSTAIASMVNRVSKQQTGARIATIEEPVHYFFPKENVSFEQRQIAIDAPSFETALEGALHSEPRLIVLSEPADAATFSMALEAAERRLIVCRISGTTVAEVLQKPIGLFRAAEQKEVRERLHRTLVGIVSLKKLPTLLPGGAMAAEVLKWRPEFGEFILDAEKTSRIQEVYGRYPESVEGFQKSIERLHAAHLISEETLQKYAEHSRTEPVAARTA